MFKQYKIPEANQFEGGPKTIAFKELTSHDEEMAAEFAGGNDNKYVIELVKQSIALLDGKPVDWGNDDVNVFWHKAGPSLRTLCVNAYVKLHKVEKKDSKSFFDSEETIVS
jgi:hypothetical protein